MVLSIWYIILTLSIGAIAVLAIAPAEPPALFCQPRDQLMLDVWTMIMKKYINKKSTYKNIGSPFWLLFPHDNNNNIIIQKKIEE